MISHINFSSKQGMQKSTENKELSNFPHIYCDADKSRDIPDRRLVTETVHILNGNLIGWFAKKKSETYRSISNAETRAIYTGVLDQNWIRNFYRSVGYPIGPP